MRNYQFKMDAPLSLDREDKNYGLIKAYKYKEIKERKEERQKKAEMPIGDKTIEITQEIEERYNS